MAGDRGFESFSLQRRVRSEPCPATMSRGRRPNLGQNRKLATACRYVGEPVAVVLGDSPALAEDGAGATALDIEELPPVPDRPACRISQRLAKCRYAALGTTPARLVASRSTTASGPPARASWIPASSSARRR